MLSKATGKGPSRRSSGEGEGDEIGAGIGVGMLGIGGQVSFWGAVSSVDGMGIGEVFVDLHGLTSGSDFHGELDIFYARGTGSWSNFSVIMDITESWLIV